MVEARVSLNGMAMIFRSQDTAFYAACAALTYVDIADDHVSCQSRFRRWLSRHEKRSLGRHQDLYIVLHIKFRKSSPCAPMP